jgi:hypothetical protein
MPTMGFSWLDSWPDGHAGPMASSLFSQAAIGILRIGLWRASLQDAFQGKQEALDIQAAGKTA